MTAPVNDLTTEATQVAQETHGISVSSLLLSFEYFRHADPVASAPGFPDGSHDMVFQSSIRQQGIDRVDIFKIDIEGAEKELFEECEDWIGRVDALVVELHGRVKPVCSERFTTATGGFDDAWRRGENEFRSRRAGCIIPDDPS